MTHFFKEYAEYIQWAVAVIAPFVAIFVAKGIYNAVWTSRQKELLEANEDHFEEEYRNWRGRVKVRKSLPLVYCPMHVGENDGPCYFYNQAVSVYEPTMPHFQPRVPGQKGPAFDMPYGQPAGRGWTVLDCFESVHFVCRAAFCLTEKVIHLKGLGLRMQIRLKDIQTVAAGCTSLLIGTKTMDRPILITRIDGQRIRDTLHVLINGQEAV